MLVTTAIAVFLIAWSSVFLVDYVLRVRNCGAYIRFAQRIGLEVSPFHVRFYVAHSDASTIAIHGSRVREIAESGGRVKKWLVWLWFTVGAIVAVGCLLGVTAYLSSAFAKDVTRWASLRPKVASYRGMAGSDVAHPRLFEPPTAPTPPEAGAAAFEQPPPVLLTDDDYDVLDGGQKHNDGLVPIIPGYNLPLEHIPVFMAVLVFAAIVHELGHAWAARANDIRVNGFGVFVWGVYPGAFTDVDPQTLKRATVFQRLMVFGGGIWHNLVLALVAFLLHSATSTMLSPLFVEGYGVTVKAVDVRSGLYGPTGLHTGDVVLAINDCDVAFRNDWFKCIRKADKQRTGNCVSKGHVDEATSYNTWASTNEVHCCDDFTVSNMHVCFEREESFTKEVASRAPQLNALLGIEPPKAKQADDVVTAKTLKTVRYSCLYARFVLEQTTCNATSDCDKQPEKSVCVFPAIFNGTQLVKIKVRNRETSVLYLGPTKEMLEYVSVHEWTPAFAVGRLEWVDAGQLIAKYLFTLSTALGLINALPCYALDGQFVVTTLLAGTSLSARKRRAIRSVVLLLGSLLLGFNVIASFVRIAIKESK